MSAEISRPCRERTRAASRAWALTVVAALVAGGGAGLLLTASAVSKAVGWAWLHPALGLASVLLVAVLLRVALGRAVASRRASEQALWAVVESIPDAVLVVGADRCVAGANRAAVELFGVAHELELRGCLAALCERHDLRYPNGARVPFEDHARVWALREPGVQRYEYEAVLRRVDGTLVQVSVSASAAPGPEGPPDRVVTVLRDVGELRRLERLRDEFLSTAAHELKTPVAVVKGYAQLLRRRPAACPSREKGLEAIDRQCDRMSRVVEDLLEVSRVRFGELRLRREPFDLSELVEEVAVRMQATTDRHRLRVEATPALVYADRFRVDQVVTNLLDNAIKFSPEGGEVRVRVEARAGQARLEVEDQGLGIPVARQRQVFERFYQAHPGQLPSVAGIGVGLYLAREIVRRHGGSIAFQTEEGRGSVFAVTLPEGLSLAGCRVPG